MGGANHRLYQRFLIPLVNASISRELVADTAANYRISFVRLTENDKNRSREHPQVECSAGGFGWMLERTANGALFEADYGGNNPLSDTAASDDLGSLMVRIDVRLPYVLWAPFGAHRLLGWPEGDHKIMFFGVQRIPAAMEAYATLNADDETSQRY